MTVCIATDGYPPQTGGIATFNRHLTNLLTKAGHRVVVLYPGYDSTINDEDSVLTEGLLTTVLLKQTYIRFKNEWQPYFKPGGYDAPNWIAIGLSMREWLMKNHKEFGIDIIEAADYGGCGIFLCDENLPPVVITGHGSLLQLSRYNNVIPDDNFEAIKWLEGASFKYASAVIAHSPINQQDLEKTIHRKIELARIPWTSSTKADITSISNSAKLIVVAGLHPVKGILEMAKAMNLLLEEKRDIKVEWIGGDTWLAPGQQKMSVYLAKQFPAIWQKTLIWRNELTNEETTKELAAAQMVIIPSVFETFNYVAVEAAALGKPIIMTEETGASYLFNSEHNAWIIPANNPGALKDAIIYLAENKSIAQSMGSEANTIINKTFSGEEILSERLNIYTNCINQATPTGDANKELDNFLSAYKKASRKRYYGLRAWLKKILWRK